MKYISVCTKQFVSEQILLYTKLTVNSRIVNQKYDVYTFITILLHIIQPFLAYIPLNI